MAIGLLFVRMLGDRFRSPWQLEVEILVLRHQLNVLQQRAHGRRPHLSWLDRALFIWLYRRWPCILEAMTIVRPETVLRWHRKGFAAYWRWKSRSAGGRPRIAQEIRAGPRHDHRWQWPGNAVAHQLRLAMSIGLVVSRCSYDMICARIRFGGVEARRIEREAHRKFGSSGGQFVGASS